MDKRDIYEHLANIYLDASSSKKKKNKKKHKFNRYIFTGSAVVILLGFFSFAALNGRNSVGAPEVALILYPDTAKINFNFNPARKEIFSLDLNRLNLSHYNTLAFALKKSNYADKISLKVEFTNSFNERSSLYLKDIPHRWNNYAVKFSEFHGISYWNEITKVSFIVEEWNAKDKKDVVYIDNIRVLR
ncbi:MAG: hypothetical protein WC532_02870 [Candidatus Omnitrophota bacterium]